MIFYLNEALHLNDVRGDKHFGSVAVHENDRDVSCVVRQLVLAVWEVIFVMVVEVEVVVLAMDEKSPPKMEIVTQIDISGREYFVLRYTKTAEYINLIDQLHSIEHLPFSQMHLKSMGQLTKIVALEITHQVIELVIQWWP